MSLLIQKTGYMPHINIVDLTDQ